MMRILAAGAVLLAITACSSTGGGGPKPPQGAGPAGTDFGYWRRDAEGAVDAAFRNFVMAKYDASDAVKARQDLSADGFECRDGNRPDGRPVPDLECIRVYQLNDDVHAWSVEFWPEQDEPHARYTRTRIKDRFRKDDD